MNIQRCFEVLKIDQNASKEEVKKAYRNRVKYYHPDRLADFPNLRKTSEEKLKEINIAYEHVQSHLSAKKDINPQADPCAGTPSDDPNVTHPADKPVAKRKNRVMSKAMVKAETAYYQAIARAMFKKARMHSGKKRNKYNFGEDRKNFDIFKHIFSFFNKML
jgi:hypothetical protein